MGAVVFTEVEKRYGERIAVAATTCSVETGQVVCLVGPSGGGKTTLLRLAQGSAAATAGQVTVLGRQLGALTRVELRTHRRATAFVDQQLHVLPTMSVHRNVMLGALPGWPWYRVLGSALWPLERERVRDVLGQVGLADRQYEAAAKLSGGQQQRVAAARLLMSTAKLWLIDEPTSALDPELGVELAKTLIAAARQRGATVIIATHRLGELHALVDRVMGVRAGCIAFDLPADQVSDMQLGEVYKT